MKGTARESSGVAMSGMSRDEGVDTKRDTRMPGKVELIRD
jgi:hypothetical protein